MAPSQLVRCPNGHEMTVSAVERAAGSATCRACRVVFAVSREAPTTSREPPGERRAHTKATRPASDEPDERRQPDKRPDRRPAAAVGSGGVSTKAPLKRHSRQDSGESAYWAELLQVGVVMLLLFGIIGGGVYYTYRLIAGKLQARQQALQALQDPEHHGGHLSDGPPPVLHQIPQPDPLPPAVTPALTPSVVETMPVPLVPSPTAVPTVPGVPMPPPVLTPAPSPMPEVTPPPIPRVVLAGPTTPPAPPLLRRPPAPPPAIPEIPAVARFDEEAGHLAAQPTDIDGHWVDAPLPGTTADIHQAVAAAADLFRKQEYDAFVTACLPADDLRQLRAGAGISSFGVSIARDAARRERIQALLDGCADLQPKFDHERAVARFVVTRARAEAPSPAPAAASLRPIPGLGSDPKQVCTAASELLAAGKIDDFVESMYPISVVERIRKEQSLGDLQETLLHNPDMLVQMQQDLTRMAALSPSPISDDTLEFRLPGVGKSPSRKVRLQLRGGHWRFFDQASDIQQHITAWLKSTGAAQAHIDWELVGDQWRLYSFEFAQ